MVNIKKKENDKRTKVMHIAFSVNEYDELNEHRGDMTRSAFIRDAIKDKIRRIENPEVFTQKVEIDNSLLKEILKATNLNTKKQELVIQELVILSDIKETFKHLKTEVNREALKEKEQKIIEILTPGELKLKRLIELSGFTKEEIYDIISNDQLFGINSKTGAIKLK